jgi:hypothetical protein
MSDNNHRRRQGGESLAGSRGAVLAEPFHGQQQQQQPPPAAAAAVVPNRHGAAAAARVIHDDDDDDDDDDEGIDVTAQSFREAAEHLEDEAGASTGGRPIRTLAVVPVDMVRLRGDDGALNSDLVRANRGLRLDFQRFVEALLRRNSRDGAARRPVRGIVFATVDWQATPEGDTARLLGEVLPRLPALKWMCFSFCVFSLPHLELFASSVPTAASVAAPAAAAAATTTSTTTTTARLATLGFEGQRFDRDSARPIADMLRRNVPLTSLSLGRLASGGVDAAGCQLIGRALSSNGNLRILDIQVKELFADTLDGVAGPASSLRNLSVSVCTPMSVEGVEGIARQLRTNTTLTRLCLRQDGDSTSDEPPADLYQPIENLLDTYNVTLEIVEVPRTHRAPPAAQARINAILRRNRHIRRALSRAAATSVDMPQDPRVVPGLLALAGRLPTLLYRFVRRGDANDWCDLVRRNTNAARRPKRRGRTARGA